MTKIFTINNKAEEKFLRKRAADFDFPTLSAGSGLKFTKKEIQELIKNMKETMKAANGVGLSANQVGLDMQLFVAEIPRAANKTSDKSLEQKSGAPKLYAVFNPKISKPSNKKITTEEGCLSVPGIYGSVERPEKITLSGFDKNGKEIKIKAIGLLARIFQHETDHLNGVLFIDKATNLRKYENKQNYEKQ